MNPGKEKKRHFLYYIFQQDKNRCIMEKEKTSALAQWFGRILEKFKKGEMPNE